VTWSRGERSLREPVGREREEASFAVSSADPRPGDHGTRSSRGRPGAGRTGGVL